MINYVCCFLEQCCPEYNDLSLQYRAVYQQTLNIASIMLVHFFVSQVPPPQQFSA